MKRILSILQRNKKRALFAFLAVSFVLFLFMGTLNDQLHKAYQREYSVHIFDRNHKLLSILPNENGEYMTEATSSRRFQELLIKSEDRFFYYHPGINPWSLVRGMFNYVFKQEHIGGSTITQQLAKNLLHHENERTIKNKIIELFYTLALECFTTKEQILSMYQNSAYFGNQRVGIGEASKYYFGKNVGSLSDGEIVRLLALLSRPASPPGSSGNTAVAKRIAQRIGVPNIGTHEPIPQSLKVPMSDPSLFEITPLSKCSKDCTLTVDRDLTKKIREIMSTNLSSSKFASVSNASVVVIKIGKNEEPNELLAIVGSPNPYSKADGNQINMATTPRPIGSTWKPFIYGKAIEKGARPYTLINDEEYRYEIGSGFAFYPKNYDGVYHGPVTLHYALSNSLNVPAVRALDFDGINEFGAFMEETLGLIPLQSLDKYQLSIALGGLEMNPLLLTHYFTTFPRSGILAPLSISQGAEVSIPMYRSSGMNVKVFSATTTELINAMLSDRLLGVEQFGLESNLNLPFQNYAVKTGTSYDYHDSWIVGYTNEIVVVAWIGNTNNKAMDILTGSSGAGKIWHDVMTLLYSDGVITPRAFDSSALIPIVTKEGRSFGLSNDDISFSRSLIQGESIVLEPHDKDVLQFEQGMTIPLRAKIPLSWKVDSKQLGSGTEVFWEPKHAGIYHLEATQADSLQREILEIHIVTK